ncbi:putative ATP-grasp target RiPP [Rhodococcus sp. PvR044]|jgi:putative ATP-grasp target RiPP|nr:MULTISPECIES: putative ATP-grasp target RiPP [Rhodococcus]MCZ4556961.1 putative ATP-grasp target RiPP [Rhodococcus maanshanensis]PTR41150.1 putative ATP-grasp target RiPP [Rhodococcus sp. OK611]SNX91972.1 putative ATP-grasp target RiPP [Rhodococcus sp. OK270]
MRDTTINEIPAAGAELNEAQLAAVSGGRASTSSAVYDVAGGYCTTDADF